MDSLVMESLFPRSTLEQLLKSLLKTRRLLIYGATGIGKSNLARYLAKYLALQLHIDSRNVVDIRYPDNDNKDLKQQQQIQEQLISILKKRDIENGPAIVIMDNIQRKRLDLMAAAFSLADSCADLTTIKKTVNNSGAAPYVICTLNRTSDNPIQNLQQQHNFTLFSLNSKMDAVKGKIIFF